MRRALRNGISKNIAINVGGDNLTRNSSVFIGRNRSRSVSNRGIIDGCDANGDGLGCETAVAISNFDFERIRTVEVGARVIGISAGRSVEG